MVGRPSIFTDEIADKICERLTQGEPLAVICRDEKMPHRSVVYDWTKTDEPFSRRIACAREDGFDAIAMRARLTIRGKTEGDGGESTSDVQRDKAIVETDLKLLSKWDPKRYGDKLQVGGDPDGVPVQSAVTVTFV